VYDFKTCINHRTADAAKGQALDQTMLKYISEELCTNYKQNIKVAVPSRFNPMSKALRLHSPGPGVLNTVNHEGQPFAAS